MRTPDFVWSEDDHEYSGHLQYAPGTKEVLWYRNNNIMARMKGGELTAFLTAVNALFPQLNEPIEKDESDPS